MINLLTAVLALLISHTPVTHTCHLQNSDWWVERVKVEHVQQVLDSTFIQASTPDGCNCTIMIPSTKPEEFPVGREFISAGWIEDQQLVLDKVCDTFEGCVARSKE